MVDTKEDLIEIARVNKLEYPSEEALNKFDEARKRGVE